MLALLSATLARLYPDYAEWKRVTTLAGVDFTRLYTQTSALNFWHAAVQEASNQRATRDLVEAAYAEFPHDPDLIRLYEFYQGVED
jgi:hypothetical protein